MNTTTHLARHILQFQPNKDAARLCLYHYLIHHCDPDSPLNPELFEKFARRALRLRHWREHRSALCQELQYILQHYNETYMLNWNLKDISFPDSWQLVEIDSKIEAIYILENWANAKFGANCSKRIFVTDDEKYICIIQNEKGELVVTEFDSTMLIRKGMVGPLCDDMTLHYTSNLELKPSIPQYISVGENSCARFYVHNHAIDGRLIRGFIFKEQQKLQGLLNQFPAIYYPLKKIEQYFIDRKSDPTYQELIQILEKAVELIKINHPEAPSFSAAALERGQAALETIFTNDNMIQVLVNQLESSSGNQTPSMTL